MLKHQLTSSAIITDSDVWEAEGCYDGNNTYPFRAFNCRRILSRRSLRRGISGRSEFRPFGRADLRRAQRNRNRERRRKDPNPNDGSFTPVSSAADHQLACSPSIAINAVPAPRPDARRSRRCGREWCRPSGPGARPPPSASTNGHEAARQRRHGRQGRRRSTALRSLWDAEPRCRSRASASTWASTRKCSAIALTASATDLLLHLSATSSISPTCPPAPPCRLPGPRLLLQCRQSAAIQGVEVRLGRDARARHAARQGELHLHRRARSGAVRRRSRRRLQL